VQHAWTQTHIVTTSRNIWRLLLKAWSSTDERGHSSSGNDRIIKAANRLVQRVEQGLRIHLKVLNLSNMPNQLRRNSVVIVPTEMKRLAHLETLTMTNCGLESFPAPIENLTSLRSLVLSLNKITSIPTWITSLAELRVLDVSWNAVATMPNELGKLKELQELNLSGNLIEVLPSSMSNMTSLRLLNIQENEKLRLIPKDLLNVKSLHRIYVSLNKTVTGLSQSKWQYDEKNHRAIVDIKDHEFKQDMTLTSRGSLDLSKNGGSVALIFDSG